MEPDDSLVVVSGVSISGNRVSKENIILKELSFCVGDSISGEELAETLERSRENLLNTALYNFVTITYAALEQLKIHVHISVIERWYIWPSPIFEHAERNLGAFIHDPDWDRINYGGQINWSNFRGRNELLKLKLRFGYKELFEVFYDKPNFGRNQNHGINLAINQTRQHEVNTTTVNNKPVYIGSDNSYLSDFLNPYLSYTYRSSLYSRHFITLLYYNLTYRDSLTHESFTGLPYGQNTDFLVAEYSFEHDYRDSRAYPLTGNYFRVGLRHREMLFQSKDLSSKTSLLFTATHHRKLSKRFFYNDALRMQISKDVYEPKVYRTGLGYGPYLRGYELFVVEGNSHALIVNNLKYCIMQEKSFNLMYIPWSQFNPVHFSMYGNLFFDLAYVHSKDYGVQGNTFVNRALYTAGLGLDLVSYYDQVVRLELSLNREGELGFFIHTEVPFGRW